VQLDLVKLKLITPDYEAQDTLRVTHKILGMYGQMPILEIAESPSPCLYVVDLRPLATLTKYGEQPEFSIGYFDEPRARELLGKHPNLIREPPPESGREDQRLRKLLLKVGLRLYETNDLHVQDVSAVLGRPLTGPVKD
jgi:hypothetical protein